MTRKAQLSVKIQRFWLEKCHILRYLAKSARSQKGRLTCFWTGSHVRGFPIENVNNGVYVVSFTNNDFKRYTCARCGAEFKLDMRKRADQFLVPRPKPSGPDAIFYTGTGRLTLGGSVPPGMFTVGKKMKIDVGAIGPITGVPAFGADASDEGDL